MCLTVCAFISLSLYLTHTHTQTHTHTHTHLMHECVYLCLYVLFVGLGLDLFDQQQQFERFVHKSMDNCNQNEVVNIFEFLYFML